MRSPAPLALRPVCRAAPPARSAGSASPAARRRVPGRRHDRDRRSPALGLRERIGRAKAGRMQRIALHLDRPADIVPHQNAGSVAVQHAGGGEQVGAGGHGIGGRPHRRDQHAARRAHDRSRPGPPEPSPPPSASAPRGDPAAPQARRPAREIPAQRARQTPDRRASSSRLRHCLLIDGISNNP